MGEEEWCYATYAILLMNCSILLTQLTHLLFGQFLLPKICVRSLHGANAVAPLLTQDVNIIDQHGTVHTSSKHWGYTGLVE